MTRLPKRAILLPIAGVLVLAGCNVGADPHKGMGDSSVAQQRPIKEIRPNAGIVGQIESPTSIINFPDKYFNVAFVCNGADGIYANTRTHTVPVVVPNDPQCRP